MLKSTINAIITATLLIVLVGAGWMAYSIYTLVPSNSSSHATSTKTNTTKNEAVVAMADTQQVQTTTNTQNTTSTNPEKPTEATPNKTTNSKPTATTTSSPFNAVTNQNDTTTSNDSSFTTQSNSNPFSTNSSGASSTTSNQSSTNRQSNKTTKTSNSSDSNSTGSSTSSSNNSNNPESTEPPPKPDLPKGDELLAGKVLDQLGQPVIGTIVRLRALRTAIPKDPRSWAGVTTGEQGEFGFFNLGAGEYVVTVEQTDIYGRAESAVRAGSTTINLIVPARQVLHVEGVVKNNADQRLAGVTVKIQTRDGSEMVTREDGQFALLQPVNSTTHLTVVFSAKGYNDVRQIARPTTSGQSTKLDIVMESIGGLALAGIVVDQNGEAVEKANISFRSSTIKVNHRAVTDKDGAFVLTGLKPAQDYTLTATKSGYEHYRQNKIKFSEGTAPIGISLNKAGASGNITGVIADAAGNPVPDFSMLVVTRNVSSRSKRLTSNGSGTFAIDGIAAGQLIVTTQSQPKTQINGLKMQDGGAISTALVVDWGTGEISGTVKDDFFNPVEGATLSLTWQHKTEGLTSRSNRRATTTPDGSFRFTELGPGERTLSVSASGFTNVRKQLDEQSQYEPIEIALKRK